MVGVLDGTAATRESDSKDFPRKYAVFREPGRVLVGIEPAPFTVIKLAEIYGSGEYQVALFEGAKLLAVYRQLVDDRLGPPKKTAPVPESALPGSM